MNDTRNRIFFWLFSTLIFIFLICKATLQAFSHDEAATFFHYIHKENFWPWQAHWDANNHILNSASAWVFYKLFGHELIWLRLPNVLSFLVYAYFIYRTSQFLKHLISRYAFQVAMLTPIFLLDFFTLCRGYGMSVAFLWGAIFYAAQFFNFQKTKHAFKMFLFIGIAVWANMSLINNMLILLVIYLFYLVFVMHSKKIIHYVLLFVLGLLFFIPATIYALQMQQKGLLYLGSTNGFMDVTMNTISVFQFGTNATWFLFLLSFIILAASAFNIFRKNPLADIKTIFLFSPFISLILIANVTGVILLEKLLHINYPEDRAGIYFIPFSIAIFCFACDSLNSKNIYYILLFPVLLFIPFRTLTTFNFSHTQLWGNLYVSEKLYLSAEKIQQEEQRELSINGYHLYEMSWAYYNLKNEGKLQNMHIQPKPDLNADLIIMPSYYFDTLKTNLYDEVYSQKFNALTLYKRKKNVAKTPYPANYTSTGISGKHEFFDIFSDTLQSNFTDIQVQFSGEFKSEKHPFHAQFVLETKDTNGNVLLYDYVPLHWIKSKWSGEQKKFIRTIPSKKHQQVIIKIYLWNIDKQQYSANIDSIKWFYIENK